MMKRERRRKRTESGERKVSTGQEDCDVVFRWGVYISNRECATGGIDTGVFRGGFRIVSAPRRRIFGARRVGNGVSTCGTYSG